MIVLGVGVGVAAAVAFSFFLPGDMFAKWREIAYAIVRYFVEKIASTFFYAGYKEFSLDFAAKRSEELVTRYGAQTLPCVNRSGVPMDALYIPSSSSLATGGVVVICLNTTYQDHNPRHWEPFLRSGADVILWNPTKLGAVSYSEDLSSLLRTLRKRDSTQVIAVKTYCASSDPGISAVAEQKDSRIHLIVDRGYGDAQLLARSMTLLADCSVVQDVIRDEWDCGGIWKVKEVYGKVAFLIAEHDQMMNCGEKNLTRELSQVKSDSLVIEMELDHWSVWTYAEYNRVLAFLSEVGVVNREFSPIGPEEFPEPALSWCAKESLPSLLKTWC